VIETPRLAAALSSWRCRRAVAVRIGSRAAEDDELVGALSIAARRRLRRAQAVRVGERQRGDLAILHEAGDRNISLDGITWQFRAWRIDPRSSATGSARAWGQAS